MITLHFIPSDTDSRKPEWFVLTPVASSRERSINVYPGGVNRHSATSWPIVCLVSVRIDTNVIIFDCCPYLQPFISDELCIEKHKNDVDDVDDVETRGVAVVELVAVVFTEVV